MKRLGFLLATFSLILTALFPTSLLAAEKFSDIENHWAQNSIERFVESETIQGYQDGSFRPDNEITRAEAAVIFAKELNLNTEGKVADFNDVSPDHYAYKYISAVSDKNIMIGNNGAFNPDKPLTRAEMAVLLTKVFDFEANGSFPFSDVAKEHWAHDYIHAVYANNVTVGYPNGTYLPDESTTRAEFTVFLGKSMDNSGSIGELLKEIYANEMLLDSYEYEGSVNLGLRLPEVAEDSSEFDMVTSLLSDIQIDMTGSYQRDPMLMDAEMTITLPGDIFPEIPISMVMSEEKMWMTLPDIPFAPLPDEVKGKYIEFDMNELAELEGQPVPTLDMDLQTELALELYNIFADQFADFYHRVNKNSVEIPENVDAHQVLKFELSDENLASFIETFLNGYFPRFVELLENPEYQEAMGFTAEDVQIINDELDNVEFDIDEIMAAINEVLTINNFEEYIVINKNNVIVQDTVDIDVDITLEGETLGLKMLVEQSKSNINGDITVTTPSAEQVIPLEEFEKMMEELEMPEDEIAA